MCEEHDDPTVVTHGEEEVKALLRALGHDDCVPRKTHLHLDDHYRLMGQERVRAERAEAERDEALRRLDEAHLARIEAQNPGIDMEQVREQRGEWGDAWGAALSADAGADAEPERPRCRTCEDTGLYPPGNDDGYGCWDCNQPPRRRDGTCAVCDQRRDADAEPSRAEGDKPEWPDCQTCNDTGAFWLGDNEYVCEDCAEGGRPREADPQGNSPSTGASVDGGGDDGRSRAMHAMWEGTAQRRGVSWDTLQLLLADALDSGGVVEIDRAAEVVDHDCAETHQQVATWAQASAQEAEARVRELEAALRYYADWTSWDRGERARAALEGGSDARA